MVVAAAGITAGGGLLSGLIGAGSAGQAASTNAAAQRAAINASLQEQQNAFQAAQYAWDQVRQNAGQYYNTGLTLADAYNVLGQRQIDAYAGLGQAIGGQYYGNAAGALNPFIDRGNQMGSQLQNEIRLGSLGAQPDLYNLQNLPGYQFTLNQGLQATQNAAAAQGLGVSGAALKGAANYAENTANTFANNYIQNYWTGQNNRYQMLAGLQNTGANAANQLGTIAGTLGGSLAGNAVTAGGQAGNLAAQAMNTIGGGTFGVGNQLTSTGGQLGAAAAGAASAAGGQQATAATQGGANVGSAQLAQGSALGGALQGAGSTIGNSLLLNQLLNNNNATIGGSTIGQFNNNVSDVSAFNSAANLGQFF